MLLIDIPTVGFPLQFALTYNSRETVMGPVGAKWRFDAMARLELFGAQATFFGGDGKQTNFVLIDGSWQIYRSKFAPMKLENIAGSIWQLTTFPDANVMEFDLEEQTGHPDSAGRLIRTIDANGNATSYEYADGKLTTVTEPTGRQLLYFYSEGLLSEVIDPMGNSYLLGYDAHSNLTSVAGPEGCVLTFGYADPTNHLLTSREDALGNIYTYTFDGDGRLLTVTDASTPPNVLTYSYDTVEEYMGEPAYEGSITLERTILVDARGKTWEFRFDPAGNLWRTIDPLGHNVRRYWSPQGVLIYQTEGYAPPPAGEGDPIMGPRDNTNNRFTRKVADSLGNVLFAVDGTGVISEFVYDDKSRQIAATPGRANFSVQGNWYGEYGADGYVLCAFEDSSNDLVSLPSYVDPSGILNGDASAAFPFSRRCLSGTSATYGYQILDPRTPVGLDPDDGNRQTYLRGVGFWQQTDSATQFCFRVPLQSAHSFNLSLYSNASDIVPLAAIGDVQYYEQFGHDLLFQIDDLDPTTSSPRHREMHVPTEPSIEFFSKAA